MSETLPAAQVLTCDWIDFGIATEDDHTPWMHRCGCDVDVAAEMTLRGQTFGVAYCTRHWQRFLAGTHAAPVDVLEL